MKRTFSLLAVAGISAAFTFSSCGGGDKTGSDSMKNDSAPAKEEEAPKPKFADVCKEGNAIAITIKDYKYGMSGKYAFETGNYEVKNSSFNMVNDSTAELMLMNYTPQELVGDRRDDQVDVKVTFYTRHGKKIQPGVYPKGASDKDMFSSVTMNTAKGTVYFNWVLGMPEAGNVTLNFADGNKACGAFALSAEKPESDMIGTVRLNGTFKVGE